MMPPSRCVLVRLMYVYWYAMSRDAPAKASDLVCQRRANRERASGRRGARPRRTRSGCRPRRSTRCGSASPRTHSTPSAAACSRSPGRRILPPGHGHGLAGQGRQVGEGALPDAVGRQQLGRWSTCSAGSQLIEATGRHPRWMTRSRLMTGTVRQAERVDRLPGRLDQLGGVDDGALVDAVDQPAGVRSTRAAGARRRASVGAATIVPTPGTASISPRSAAGRAPWSPWPAQHPRSR